MTDETSADDRRDTAARATGDGPADATSDGGVNATGDEPVAGDWNPNEPVPAELRTGADGEVDDDLRETVAEDLAELEGDEPDYPSSDDPVEPQRVDVENAVFVVLGVAAILALVAVLLLGA